MATVQEILEMEIGQILKNAEVRHFNTVKRILNNQGVKNGRDLIEKYTHSKLFIIPLMGPISVMKITDYLKENRFKLGVGGKFVPE